MTAVEVFEPDAVDDHELCHPIDPEDFDRFITLIDGEPRAKTWKPIAVEIVHEDEGRALLESDSPFLGPHALIFRKKAVEAMGPLLRRNGELLPLACDEAELFVFNPTRVLDALDESASDIVRFDDGSIMTIERHVFRPDAIQGVVDAFKVPRLRASPTYVLESFVDAWQAAGLTGLTFRQLWPPRRKAPKRRKGSG